MVENLLSGKGLLRKLKLIGVRLNLPMKTSQDHRANFFVAEKGPYVGVTAPVVASTILWASNAPFCDLGLRYKQSNL